MSPDISPVACPDGLMVCLTPEDAAKVANYKRQMDRVRDSLAVCNQVKQVKVPYSPEQDKVVSKIMDDLTFPTMTKPSRMWTQCGSPNAAYMPLMDMMYMCTELPEKLIPFVTAHEMAHAVIYQMQIPYTGSQEVAADELASIYLASTGQRQSILDFAIFDYGMPDPGVDDEHPQSHKRAWTVACLEDGSEVKPIHDMCHDWFTQAAHNWYVLITEAMNRKGL